MKKKSISLILTLALSISCVGTTVFADPNTSTRYDQELETNTNNYKSAQEKVDEIEAAIQQITGQMDSINAEIESLNTQINDTEAELEESNIKIKETEENIEEEGDLFNQRMRAMYMNGFDSYVNVLLESEGISDFLSRLNNIVTIINYDNEVRTTLNSLKKTLVEETAKIEEEKAKLVVLKDKADEKATALDEKKKEQEEALAVAEENRDLYLAAKEETEAQIQQALQQLQSSGTGSSGSSPSRPSRGDSATGTTAPGSASGSSIVEYAKQFLGVPYQWGGNGPNTFDCSGLTRYVYRAFGINLPRVAQDQMNAGTPVSRGNLQPGDLVFFGTPGNIYHVGIYVGNDCYLHAPQTGDVVKISPLTYRYDYAGGRRY